MWARVPVSELYKLPLFNYRKIVTEDGFTLYDHQSEGFTIIVDEEGVLIEGGDEKTTPVYFDSLDDFREFYPPLISPFGGKSGPGDKRVCQRIFPQRGKGGNRGFGLVSGTGQGAFYRLMFGQIGAGGLQIPVAVILF